MRIQGQVSPARYSRVVEWPRPDGTGQPLTLQPLPLGFHRRLREHGISPPVPPTRVARDSAGKPIRDARGLAVLTADEHDPLFLAAQEQHQQRVAALIVFHGLAADPQVQFDTTFSLQGDWADAADALLAELERSGWSAGDLIWVCRQVLALSNLWDEHVQEAHANFSRSPPAPVP